MCGRLVLTASEEELADLFGATVDSQLMPRWNIAPSQSLPVVRNVEPRAREIVLMRWGFVPRWNAESHPAGFINARSETASAKPTFREAFRKRRCLIPTSGFYEWKSIGTKRKQPFFFRQAGGGILALAGLWETWTGPDGPMDTVAILTTAANDLVRPLHDRMPAIIPPTEFTNWLDTKASAAESLLPMLRPYSSEAMEFWPVADRVNLASIEEPNLNAPLDASNSSRQSSLFEID